MLTVGRVVAGKYCLDRVVDCKGGAALWAATDITTRRPVALKVLSETLPDMPRAIGAFVAAGRRSVDLPHPAFVGVTAIGRTDQGIPFLVTDFVEGETLRHVLDRGGPLPVARALAVMEVVLDALSAAHEESRSHGDMKPANIVLPALGSDATALRIVNFGLSRPMIAAEGTSTPERIVGVLDYVAPERLLRPGAPPTPASDVFSCGVILAEMILGQLPLAPLKPDDPTIDAKLADRNAYYLSGHAVPLPTSVLRDLPPPLVDVLRCATAVAPSHRFEDAEDMLDALREAVGVSQSSWEDAPKFIEAATIVSDPPFDLESFRAEHPERDDAPPDQRETMILADAEESTIESTIDQDTVEMSPLEQDAPERVRPSPLGDPFEPSEPPRVVRPQPSNESSFEDLRTDRYRSPEPPIVPRPGQPLFGQGVGEVKTVVFDSPDPEPEGLENAPTRLLDSAPVAPIAPRADRLATPTPSALPPPWQSPAPAHDAPRGGRVPAIVQHQLGGRPEPSSHHLAVLATLIALFGLLAIGLLVVIIIGLW